jgi:hypothetical protein
MLLLLLFLLSAGYCGAALAFHVQPPSSRCIRTPPLQGIPSSYAPSLRPARLSIHTRGLGSRRWPTGPLRAWPTGRDPKSFAKDFPLAAARISATILATLLTYTAHTNRRCSPVLASAAVTLAASLVAPGLGQVRASVS